MKCFDKILDICYNEYNNKLKKYKKYMCECIFWDRYTCSCNECKKVKQRMYNLQMRILSLDLMLKKNKLI